MSKQVDKQAEATLLQKITDMAILFKCPEESLFLLSSIIETSDTVELLVINALSLAVYLDVPLDDFEPLALTVLINDFIFNQNNMSLLSKINDYIFNQNLISISNKINDYIFDSNSLSIIVEVQDLA